MHEHHHRAPSIRPRAAPGRGRRALLRRGHPHRRHRPRDREGRRGQGLAVQHVRQQGRAGPGLPEPPLRTAPDPHHRVGGPLRQPPGPAARGVRRPRRIHRPARLPRLRVRQRHRRVQPGQRGRAGHPGVPGLDPGPVHRPGPGCRCGRPGQPGRPAAPALRRGQLGRADRPRPGGGRPGPGRGRHSADRGHLVKPCFPGGPCRLPAMPENGLDDGAAEAPGSTTAADQSSLITARSGTRRIWWAPWVIASFVCAVYLALSLFRYLQLNPSSWDLGIFTEQVKQYAHLHAPVADVRGAGFNLLGDHFSPIVALIAPFFLVAPSPVTLLVAQAALTAVSVLPVTWVAAEKLGRRAGAAIGLAYGFSWGLQQMIDFDFHEVAFALPLLAFSMAGLIRGRYRTAVLWALPLVFVKEDQGFTVAALGVLMIVVSLWRDDPRQSVRGAMIGGQFLVLWGIAWSVLAIT